MSMCGRKQALPLGPEDEHEGQADPRGQRRNESRETLQKNVNQGRQHRQIRRACNSDRAEEIYKRLYRAIKLEW